jgi:hypothetical protein
MRHDATQKERPMAARTTRSRSHGGPALAAVALVVGALVVHILLREHYSPGHPIRLAATVVLAACFALLIWVEVRAISAHDEFTRSVHALALAIAFPCSLVAVFTLGYLRAEGLLAGADPRDLPLVMIAVYAVSLALAWRRYR